MNVIGSLGLKCPNCRLVVKIPFVPIDRGCDTILLEDFDKKIFVCRNCNTVVNIFDIKLSYEVCDDIPF